MNDVIKDLSELRLSYEQGELHESQISVNPHEQFLSWFNHALTAQLHEPYAMSLATANTQGRPHVRTVLLRGATEAGYDFYTNYDSHERIRTLWKILMLNFILLIEFRTSGTYRWSGFPRFQNRNRRIITISVHVIAKLRHISAHHKVVSLKAVSYYNSVFKTYKTKYMKLSWINPNFGVVIA